MGLAVVKTGEGDSAGLNTLVLDRLQWEQFEHDEKFHREIARLTVQDRLKHMALHFAKYAGEFITAVEDEARRKRLATDVFVIAISTANVLNMRLSDRISFPDATLDAQEFLFSLAVNAGRMAAACEKMDHLEDYPFRTEIAAALVQLATAAVAYAKGRGWNLEALVHDRLQPVKEKSIFYGRI